MPARGQALEKASNGDFARLGGIIAHRILERWDYAADPSRFGDQIEVTLRACLTNEQQTWAPALSESLQELFFTFGRSEIYSKLRVATILGREIPFVMPWDEGQVMEGIIDLVCRLDGRLWIADYKTDAVSADAVPRRAEVYHRQAEIYKTAVQQSLGISSPVFQLIFLRPGVAIEI